MSRKIALIDDDLVELEILSGLARYIPGDYDFDHFPTLQGFLDDPQPERFDLVLLDRRLPPYESFEQTLPALLATRFAGRIVLLSACCSETRTLADHQRVTGPIDKLKLQNLEILETVLSRSGQPLKPSATR